MKRYNQNLMRILIFTISTVLLILPFGVYASGTGEAVPGPDVVSESAVSTNAISDTVSSDVVSEDAASLDTVSNDSVRYDTISGNAAGPDTISGNSVSSDSVDENTSEGDPESRASSGGTGRGEASPESGSADTGEKSPESTKESSPESTGESGSESKKEGAAGSQAENESKDSTEKGPDSDPGTATDPLRETETQIQETEPDPETVKEQKPEETPTPTPAAEEAPKPVEETPTPTPAVEETPKPAEETPAPVRQENVPAKTEGPVIVDELKTETEAPKEAVKGQTESGQEESKTKKEDTESREEDSRNPEIRISGVEDRSANRKPLSVSVTFEDEHLVKESAYAYITATNSGKRMDGTKNSETKTSVTLAFSEITEDDYYVLTAGCRDESGNEAALKISFTENQKGPVTALKNVSLKDSEVNEKEVVPEFHVSGVDEITEVTADVNGKEVPVRFNKEGNLVLTDPLTKEGEYTVRVKTKDASGNEAHSDPVTFVIDRTKPEITMKKQKNAGGSFSVIISKDQKKDRFTEVLLDGRKLEKDEYEERKDGSILVKIDGKGKHTVRATAKDAAGNTRTYSQTFTGNGTVRGKNGAGWRMIAGILAIAAGGIAAAVYFFYFRKRIR